MKNNYYFDNAATTLPKPEPVYQFMDKFFRSHGVNPGRSGHELAIEAETMIIQTRRMLGEFFGFSGDSNRVTFSLNATDSMNQALLGLLNPGDHMIITRVEHNAVLRPANHLERDGGVTVSRIVADGQLASCGGDDRAQTRLDLPSLNWIIRSGRRTRNTRNARNKWPSTSSSVMATSTIEIITMMKSSLFHPQA